MTLIKGFHDETAFKKMVFRDLGKTGMKVSLMGLGTSAFGSIYNDVKESECIEIVHTSLKSGINLIDTAPWYGHGKSETTVGKALKSVPRNAYYIASKVGRYKPETLEMFDFSYERTLQSVDESLKRLGVDCIDIMQVHDPEFCPDLNIIIKQTLPALEVCRRQKKIRFIGVTGYPLSAQRYIIENAGPAVHIDTSLVYCHYSLNDTSLISSGFFDMLQQRGIGCINASPIAMGLLCEQGPPVWHPASAHIKKVCADAVQYSKSQGVDLSTIAIDFSLHSDKRIPSLLISTHSLPFMKSNLTRISNTLSDKEKAVRDYVMKTYFEPLRGQESWEGLETAKYFQKVGKSLLIQRLYTSKM